MDFSNQNIGKYKILIWLGAVLLGVSIPLALGSAGEGINKIKSHRDASVKVLSVQAKEVCDWEVKYLLEKNKTLTTANEIDKNTAELRKPQENCLDYVIEKLTNSFTKTK